MQRRNGRKRYNFEVYAVRRMLPVSFVQRFEKDIPAHTVRIGYSFYHLFSDKYPFSYYSNFQYLYTSYSAIIMQFSLFIKSFADLTVLEYHRIIQAREAVFHLEQHITCADADSADLQSVFIWMENADRVVAFLRVIPPGVVCPQAAVGRVLVDAEYRRNGLCRKLMGTALQYISDTWGSQPICLSAQLYLAGFYASLGFKALSEPYTEAGIQHIKMLRE